MPEFAGNFWEGGREPDRVCTLKSVDPVCGSHLEEADTGKDATSMQAAASRLTRVSSQNRFGMNFCLNYAAAFFRHSTRYCPLQRSVRLLLFSRNFVDFWNFVRKKWISICNLFHTRPYKWKEKKLILYEAFSFCLLNVHFVLHYFFWKSMVVITSFNSFGYFSFLASQSTIWRKPQPLHVFILEK